MAHIERLLGYTSGFVHSKTDHDQGTSTGENEQRIPLIPAHETDLMDDTQVIVKRSGIRCHDRKETQLARFPRA
jgi:hypothetical protein